MKGYPDMNPTAEQIEALKAYAATHGRTWKSQLNHAWITCQYDRTDNRQQLQLVRNQFGPSWLVRFRLPKAVQQDRPALLLADRIFYNAIRECKDTLGLCRLWHMRDYLRSQCPELWQAR